MKRRKFLLSLPLIGLATKVFSKPEKGKIGTPLKSKKLLFSATTGKIESVTKDESGRYRVDITTKSPVIEGSLRRHFFYTENKYSGYIHDHAVSSDRLNFSTHHHSIIIGALRADQPVQPVIGDDFIVVFNVNVIP